MEVPIKSATFAMKAKQILQREGIRSSSGKKSGKRGCEYYIKFSDRDSEKAWKLLRDHGIIQ